MLLLKIIKVDHVLGKKKNNNKILSLSCIMSCSAVLIQAVALNYTRVFLCREISVFALTEETK